METDPPANAELDSLSEGARRQKVSRLNRWMEAEQQKKMRRTVSRLIEVGDEVAMQLTMEFEALRAVGSPEIRSPRLGFANLDGLLGPEDTRNPAAPAKYAIEVRDWVKRAQAVLPFFKGTSSAFEIGVGPGYLMALLKDALGIAITGIDVDLETLGVYRRLREELGLSHLVSEHRVAAYAEVPIPQNTEAVLTFGSVFDAEWGVPEHEWFVQMCRAKGVRRLYFGFNKATPTPEVRAFYSGIGKFQSETKRLLNKLCIADL